jgi:hypothetical protein
LKRAYLLTTTAIAVAYLTILLIQGLSEEVSILRDLATQRAAVTRLSYCAEAISDDLPRYLRREVEREILRSASSGDLPDPLKIGVEEWRGASSDYLVAQEVLAELDIGEVSLSRSNAPEGAVECNAALGYVIQDRICETELRGGGAITFIVPVKVYLMSDVAANFRWSIADKIKRAFSADANTSADAVRGIISETIGEYKRSCAGKGLEFEANVGMEFSRDNETTTVRVSYDDLKVTDMGPSAEILVDGKLTRVTFRMKPSNRTLVFRRN